MILLLVIRLLLRVTRVRLLIIYIVARVIAGVRVVLVLFSLSVAAAGAVITFQVGSVDVLVFLAFLGREREREAREEELVSASKGISNALNDWPKNNKRSQNDRLPGEMKPRPQYLQMYGNSLVCL